MIDMVDMVEYDIAQVKPNVTICSKYEQTFNILGKRWNALIIDVLSQSEMRFSELSRTIEDLSDRVLTERLHELEEKGIVEKNTNCFGTAKFTYRLTKRGKELAKATESLKKWSEKWMAAETE